MTLVVAHRGAAANAPENTMPAFQLAVDMGADAIELDVHLTADGKLAVMHDETLERTTDRSGTIASMTMAQIRRADAGYRFEAADGSFPFRGKKLRVPTLPEVLTWLPDGIGLVVEVKARDAIAPTVKALRRSRVRAANAVSLVSFDEHTLERSRELDPDLPTGYLLVPSQSVDLALTFAVEHGFAAIHPWEGDLGLDPTPLLYVANAYRCLVGCYVVNDPERMKQLAAVGLWGFVTDLPGVARVVLGPRQETAPA
jgi:glycerophosphoryl diester phosphodiesterase